MSGMEKIKIRGGTPLHGEITVGGAKNAVLPAMFACLLTDGECQVGNIPSLRDIDSAGQVLRAMGATCEIKNGTATICARELHTCEAPYKLVKTMRASILALGPLLARFGSARVSLPGGCAIGARPVDMHLRGLRRMGATIKMEGGNIVARAKRLRGARIVLPKPTVTGSENLMMAAVLAEGETIIENAAREPEIADLASFLNAMGARIEGADTGVLHIHGVSSLHGATHDAPPDRIEAGTYLCAVAACGGDAVLRGANTCLMGDVLEKFTAAGAQITAENDGLRIVMTRRPLSVDADTAPYPGFPTDMQAQWMAVNCVAEGTATIVENIFENRFMHVPELIRAGADIKLRRNAASVRGVERLSGAPMMATDLRASASLIVAALAAEGESVIDRIYHLDRGYDNLVGNLCSLGADAKRIPA